MEINRERQGERDRERDREEEREEERGGGGGSKQAIQRCMVKESKRVIEECWGESV